MLTPSYSADHLCLLRVCDIPDSIKITSNFCGEKNDTEFKNRSILFDKNCIAKKKKELHCKKEGKEYLMDCNEVTTTLLFFNTSK